MNRSACSLATVFQIAHLTRGYAGAIAGQKETFAAKVTFGPAGAIVAAMQQEAFSLIIDALSELAVGRQKQ